MMPSSGATGAFKVQNATGMSLFLINGSDGNVGIGTATPSQKLHVDGSVNITGGRLFVGNATFGNTTAVAVFADGIGKIDVGVIDPVYTINGEKYATYCPAMMGIKEEVTGIITLDCKGLACSKKIDFNQQQKGSDIWLFTKTTNLKENFNKMTVIMTPGFDGRAWYRKDINTNQLTIFAILEKQSEAPEISYRFTAPRFDYEQWKTAIPESTTTGYVIND